MDKQEYRTKLDEAQKLIEEGDKEEAFYILDGMNWRRVHNVNALLAASVLYENEGRYVRAKELLELAHERSPIGRMIIYRLALLCIRLEDYDEAKEYYDEFVEIAPHDSLQYIIQYQLAKARGAEDITLISILEELKEHDFLEEWAYELALLYHKTGQINKCISTCDEIILWYGDGPYVESALELKLLYQPLDEGQQHKYKDFLKRRDGIIEVKPGEEFGGNGEILSAPIEIPAVAINNDRFNTQNLQAEIKRNIEEIMQASKPGEVSENMEAIKELVEDIPYAKVLKEDTGPVEEVSIKKEEGRRIDDTLRNHFKEYLEEERDGQMSLSLPDEKEAEPQIAGQMTIEQIMNDWQKTARAAEQALSEADELRLENAKARAIEEANRIIERLEQAKRKLDAGVAPKDLLKSEYMADIPSQGEELKRRFSALKKQLGAAEEPSPSVNLRSDAPAQDTTFLPTGVRAERKEAPKLEEEGPEEAVRRFATKRIDKPEDRREREALKNQSTFKIKKVDAITGKEAGVGFEVPIMEAEDIPEKIVDPAARAEKLSRDATRIVSDVNEMLQKEIDRATGRMPKRAEVEKAMAASSAAKPEEGSADTMAAGATVGGASGGLAGNAGTSGAAGGIPTTSDGKFDLSQLPTEQTQAFAEAVIRILNEQARKEAEEHQPKMGFDTMSRTLLTEVETGTAGAEEVEAAAALTEVETGEEARKEAQREESLPQVALTEVETGEEARREAEREESLPQVALTEVETGEEVAKEKAREDDIPQVALLEVETGSEELASADAAGGSDAVRGGSGDSGTASGTGSSGDEADRASDDSTADEADDDDLIGDEVPEIEISEEQFAEAIYDELPQTELSDEERELFTYFTPINGMEASLCQVLTGVRAKLMSDRNPATGNIIIQGGEGSGKTTLATSLITVLQRETGKPDGNVGRIDGSRLNTKDLSKLFDKIRGGSLIIERVGEISRDTALELSAQMEQDKSGILVILEDARIGIERAMALNPMFSRRFTEKVVIPVLTIDELVNFGKAYSMELGYSIDEMGVLALYDRINLIQRTDHPTNLTEVKAIVDEAIDIAEGGGFRGFFGRFGGRHYDQDGNLILQEKDFHGR